MRVILHIGSTKTGSSAVQRYLAKNAARLEAEGVCYPNVGMAAGAHHLIAAALHPSAHNLHRDIMPETPQGRLDMFRTLMDEAHAKARAIGAHTLLLSSEYLWSAFSEADFAHLTGALEGSDVSIYAVLRKPDQWLQSSYLQTVKSGEAQDFGPWFEMVRKRPGRINIATVLRAWQRTMGDCIHLRGYEDQLARDAVFTDIAEFAGAPLLAADGARSPRVNPSPSAEGVAMLLEINRSDRPADVKARERKRVMETMIHRDVGSHLHLADEARQSEIEAFYRPIVADIVARFGPEKTRFIKDYWGDLAG